MQNRHLLPSIVVLAVLGAAAWFLRSELFSDAPEEGPRPAPSKVETKPSSSEPRPETLVADPAAAAPEVPEARKDPQDKSKFVRYPDGQYLPALNGVVGAPPMTWDDRPYSPVVGIRTTPDGTRWYVHADGSMTTMYMAWRDDLGRMDPVVEHVRPTETAPYAGAVLPGEGPLGPVVNHAGRKSPAPKGTGSTRSGARR